MRLAWTAALAVWLGACASDDAGLGSGERGALCSNGRDDDHDGFTDCADQDCLAVCDGDTHGADTSDTVTGGDATTQTTDATGTQATDTTQVTDTVQVEVSDTCDPCTGLGSLKGRVCSPSQNVFISGATVTVTGTGCNGAPFTQTVDSSVDGSYYLLDLPCGAHSLVVTKGSFQSTHPVNIKAGQLTDVTGAANKLCLGSGAAKIAVLAGSYDSIESLIAQLGLNFDFYNDDGDQGADGAIVALLADNAKLRSYDIVFADCGGTHGWMPQDHPEVMDNVKDFVLTGGSLYMSDYAWTYGEWAFPDKVEWAGNDDVTSMGKSGSPQQIPSDTTVTARVVDGTLASYLGKNTLTVTFDQGPQIATQSVANGAFAHVVADIQVPLGFQGKDVPLVISYVPAQGAGRVIYTNFHNDAQTSSDMLAILQYLVFTL